MKIIAYIILVLFPALGSTQTFSLETQKQIDSLNIILTNPNSHDTLLAQTYISLSEILYVSSFDTMYYLNNKAKQIAEKGLENPKSEKIKISLLKSLASAYGNIGYVTNYRGNSDEALILSEKSLKLSEQTNDKNGISSMLNNIGLIYSNQGNAKKALEYYNRCLNIRIEIDDKKGLATIYNNIGAEYRKQGDYNKTLEYYKKSLSYSQLIKNKRNIARNMNNIGFVYFTLKEIDTASYYWEHSLKIRQEIGDDYGRAESYTNLANVKEYNGELDEALDYLMKSLDIYQELNIKTNTLSSVLSKISRIYYKKNDIKTALKYGNKGLNLSQEKGFLEGLMLNAENLYKINKDIGNNKTALVMHEIYITMRDSIQNDKNQNEVIKNEFKNEYEKQHLSDSLAFVKEEELKEIEHQAQLDKEQNQKYFLYGGIIVLVIIGGMAFNSFQRKKKDNKLITAQKEEVELAHHELEEKNQEILDSITYAKRIQSAILPQEKLVKQQLKESFILYKPKAIVAGDFYWVESVSSSRHSELDSESPDEEIVGQVRNDDSLVLFAAADCTGHGVPGAMVSVVCNNALNRSVREYGLTEPGKILDKTREIVIQEFEKSHEEVKDGMDIALCSLKLPSREGLGGVLKYAGANNPLWIIRKGEIIETKANKQPIGQSDNLQPYTTHKIELEKGDSIYIFSDGYADQFGGEKGKKYKAANFKRLLLSLQSEKMEKQKELINSEFENWKGNLEQIDDVCVIGIRI
jgi:serine phosphatase RsbU (regulator of sigma subunit)